MCAVLLAFFLLLLFVMVDSICCYQTTVQGCVPVEIRLVVPSAM